MHTCGKSTNVPLMREDGGVDWMSEEGGGANDSIGQQEMTYRYFSTLRS